MELYALQKHLAEFTRAGATLVAISPETPDHSLSTHEKNKLAFDVLYDQGNRSARDFGLVFELPQVLRPIYEKLGIDITSYNGDKSFTLAIPATYIIKQDGSIAYHFIDADHTKRVEPSFILKQLALS
ncbi:MAG: hypothetical protein DSY70_04265 [Desulfobulbus sp.]|nr:MAG: hypothetical protein DSY70_04265 [Desulfobulbus sp.]